MNRYLILLKFTDQGVKALAKSPARAAAFARSAARSGVQVEAQYWSLGAWDGVLIVSASSSKKALQPVLRLAATGNVTTHTLPLLDAGEFRRLIVE